MEQNNLLLPKTFLWMFFGLLVTAITSWFTYSSGMLENLIYSNSFNILLILEIVVVLIFSFALRKLSPMVAELFFFGYAILNGVTISVIFGVFELSSIIYVFLASGALFGLLAFYGYRTGADLSNWRTTLCATLFVGLILSIINLFILKNTMVEVFLDWAILAVFCGVTIYDMNKIKRLQYDNSLDQSKLYIYGAMELYLDFINIFLRLLSRAGKRRD